MLEIIQFYKKFVVVQVVMIEIVEHLQLISAKIYSKYGTNPEVILCQPFLFWFLLNLYTIFCHIYQSVPKCFRVCLIEWEIWHFSSIYSTKNSENLCLTEWLFVGHFVGQAEFGIHWYIIPYFFLKSYMKSSAIKFYMVGEGNSFVLF